MSIASSSGDNGDIESSTTDDTLDSIVAKANLATMFFGVFGNLLSIGVLMQKRLLARKFNFYLLMLALNNLTFCLVVFTNYVIMHMYPNRALYDMSRLTCFFTDFVLGSVDAFSVYITLILSVDRLYAIVKPIQIRTFVTHQYPKRLVAIVYTLLLVAKLPELMLNQRTFSTGHDALGVAAAATTPSSANIFKATAAASPLVVYLQYNESTSVHKVFLYPRDIRNDDDHNDDGDHSRSSSSETTTSTTTANSQNDEDASSRLTSHCYSPHMFHATMSDDSSSSDAASGSGSGNTSEESQLHMLYIIYNSLIIPLVLNILPAFVILVLNLLLGFFIRRYNDKMRAKYTGGGGGGVSTGSGTSGKQVVAVAIAVQNHSTQRAKHNKVQQSHYAIIIIIGIWLLVTSIPYYSFFTLLAASSLRLIAPLDMDVRLQMSLQALSSAFFNTNHCISIVVYLIFHADFRITCMELAIGAFNLNPVVSLNPAYFDSIRRARRQLALAAAAACAFGGGGGGGGDEAQHNVSPKTQHMRASIRTCGSTSVAAQHHAEWRSAVRHAATATGVAVAASATASEPLMAERPVDVDSKCSNRSFISEMLTNDNSNHNNNNGGCGGNSQIYPLFIFKMRCTT